MKCNKNINKSHIKYKTRMNLVRNVQKPIWERIDKILPTDQKKKALKTYHIHGWEDLIL